MPNGEQLENFFKISITVTFMAVRLLFRNHSKRRRNDNVFQKWGRGRVIDYWKISFQVALVWHCRKCTARYWVKKWYLGLYLWWIGLLPTSECEHLINVSNVVRSVNHCQLYTYTREILSLCTAMSNQWRALSGWFCWAFWTYLFAK